MAKKVWAEGDILYATGDNGLNNNVLQYVNSDFTADGGSAYDNGLIGTTETQFTNKAALISGVKKRVLILANCRVKRAGVGTQEIISTFRIKIGTSFATSTTKATLALYSGNGVNNESAGVISYVDESTDFTGNNQYVYISVQFNSGVDNNYAYCDNLLVIGA